MGRGASLTGEGSVDLTLARSFVVLAFVCTCFAFFAARSSFLVALGRASLGSVLSSGCGVPGLLVTGVIATEADWVSDDASVSADPACTAVVDDGEAVVVFAVLTLSICLSEVVFLEGFLAADALFRTKDAFEVDAVCPSLELEEMRAGKSTADKEGAGEEVKVGTTNWQKGTENQRMARLGLDQQEHGGGSIGNSDLQYS